MAIHHDKLAYGKLASSMEDLSAERVDEMLRLLEDTDDGGSGDKKNGDDEDSAAATADDEAEGKTCGKKTAGEFVANDAH